MTFLFIPLKNCFLRPYVGTTISAIYVCNISLDSAENQQFLRPYQEMLAKRSKLPAYEMRDYIVRTVKDAQVVVVSGETGCGKTTQAREENV